MAQGKMKNKTKTDIKLKQKKKGQTFTRRANAPIKSKKDKHSEHQRLKTIITKNVNKTVETEIRSAAQSNVKFSKAQEAVKKFTEKTEKESVDQSAASTSSSNFP